MRHLVARTAVAAALILVVASPAAHADDFATRFPESTLIYIASDGVDAHRSALSTTALGLVLDSPIGDAPAGSIAAAFLDLVRQFDDPFGVDSGVEQVPALAVELQAALATAPWAFGVTGVGDLSRGSAPAEFAACLDDESVGQQLFDLLTSRTGDPESIELSGHSVRVIPDPAQPLYAIVADGRLVVATSTDLMSRWLSPEKPSGRTFADREEFVRGVDRSSAGGEVLSAFFLDYPTMLSFIPPDQPSAGSDMTFAQLRDAFGLWRCRGVTITSSVRNARVRDALYIDLAPKRSEPSEAQDADSVKPPKLFVDDEQLKNVPRGTHAVWAGRLDLRAFIDGYLARAESVDETGAEGIRAELEGAARAFLGVELGDFLSALGTQCTIHEDPGARGLVPGVLVRLRPTDPDLVETAVEGLLRSAGQITGAPMEIQFHELAVGETTVRYAQAHRAPVPIAPAWARIGDELVVGLHPTFVATAVEAAGSGEADSILDDPEFVAAREALPRTATSLAYLDNNVIALCFYAIGVYGQQMMIGLLEAADASGEPRPERLAHELARLSPVLARTKPQLGVTALVDGGYLVVTEGSTTNSSSSIAVGASAIIGVAATTLLPAVQVIRNRADALAVRMDGDKLFQFAKHAMSKLDRAPRDVAEILEHRGTFKFEPENEWSVHPTSIGFMLVQESGFQKDGKILVVLTDGWTGWIRRADFERLKDDEMAIRRKMNED